MSPSTILDIERFQDELYHLLSELGRLVTWKWVERSDLAATGAGRHTIIDVPRYRDGVTEKCPFWYKEATCTFRIVFNPDGGGLVSGRRKPSRKEPPNVQVIPDCFKPDDGAPSKWRSHFYIHFRQPDTDAALRQVLQTIVNVLELSRHPEAKAKLFALVDPAPELQVTRLAPRQLIAAIEPPRRDRNLHLLAEPALSEFRGPGPANIKAFNGWQPRADAAGGQQALRAVFSLHASETHVSADGNGTLVAREFDCGEEDLELVLSDERLAKEYPRAHALFRQAWEDRPSRRLDPA